MGKSKTRILRKGINDKFLTMTREDAINNAAKFINNNNLTEAKKLITMFGLAAEDVLEAGATYEIVTSMRNIFND